MARVEKISAEIKKNAFFEEEEGPLYGPGIAN